MKQVLLLAACLALAAPALAGCGSAGLAAGATGADSRPQLQLLLVDEGPSRQAQAGPRMPLPQPGDVILRQLERDDAGNIQLDYYGKEMFIPWFLKQDNVLTSQDVISVTNPGTDASGNPFVEIALTGAAVRRLDSLGRGGSGSPLRAAVVIDNEVRAVLTLPLPSGASEIRFNCPGSEALQIEAKFSRR